MKTEISTKHAPGAIGPYAQAIEAGGLLFTSGQLPVTPQSGEMPEDVRAQARQSLENVKAIVEEAGATLADVVKTTVFLQDMGDFAAVNEVYAGFFSAPYPARSCVQVARLPKDAKIEIECVVKL